MQDSNGSEEDEKPRNSKRTKLEKDNTFRTVNLVSSQKGSLKMESRELKKKKKKKKRR